MSTRPGARCAFLASILCVLLSSQVLAFHFDDPVVYPVGDSPYSVATGDFDGDLTTDLAIANKSDNTISVLQGLGDGTFKTPTPITCGQGPTGIAVGDLNLDGHQDLAVTREDHGSVSILLGNGDGSFGLWQGYTVGAGPRAVLIVDLNVDGFPDLATANNDGDSVSVLLGDGSGTFPAVVDYPAGESPCSIIADDLDLDGAVDLATANSVSNDISILLGNGDGTFSAGGAFAAGSIPWSLSAGDLNLDGIPDLVVANYWDIMVSVFLGNGDGTYQPRTIYGVYIWPKSVAIDDVDHDGYPDLVVSCSEEPFAGPHPGGQLADDRYYGDGVVTIYSGRGDGTFGHSINLKAGTYPVAIITGDINGDGYPDLVLADRTEDATYVVLNLGCTVSTEMTCLPGSGTLPFDSRMRVTFANRYSEQRRRFAARINVRTADNTQIHNWRSGYLNILPAESKTFQWTQHFPAINMLNGDNRYTLLAEDVTPAPYNQPPYPPSGATDNTHCVVTGIAP
jgi:hypothetical protein